MGGNCITKTDEGDNKDLQGKAFKMGIDKEETELPEALHAKHGPKQLVATRLKEVPSKVMQIIQRNLLEFGQFPHQEVKGHIQGVYLDPYELSDGSIYIGHWWQGKRSGNGILVEADGTMVEGLFVKDVREGICRAIYPNGDVYTGMFVNEMPGHQGKYLKADGTYYDGDWLNGRQEGFGIETWANGEIYKGDFRGGKKDGSGELTNDTFRYKGEFKENNIEGRGIHSSHRRDYLGYWTSLFRKLQGWKNAWTWTILLAAYKVFRYLCREQKTRTWRFYLL